MKRAFHGILVFTALLLAQCDRDRSVGGNLSGNNDSPPPKNEPTGPTTKVRLFLFGAGFCGPCKRELPVVQTWFNTKMSDKKDRILPTVYFTAGNPATVVANQKDADAFKKDLGLEFEVIADPRSKKYRDYYKEGTSVPATVLLKENGEVIKAYPRVEVPIDTLLATFEADINEALSKETK